MVHPGPSTDAIAMRIPADRQLPTAKATAATGRYGSEVQAVGADRCGVGSCCCAQDSKGNGSAAVAVVATPQK